MITIAILTLGPITSNTGTQVPHAERTKRLSALVATSVGPERALAMLELASERILQRLAVQ